ncbi:MAG TPA: nickel-binding protein [Clostridia bacterium]
MARIFVFHFTDEGRLPKLEEDQFIELRNKFLDVLKDYPNVHFNGTFIDENGMGVCDWEAPSPEIVKEVVEKALGAPPADPVIAVNQVFL